ncbi:MAG: hypothetical protein KDA68_10965 [Planctomycetaceae bacterium]|nr:hypothetical protein [Planctomycetaceae bacterium]
MQINILFAWSWILSGLISGSIIGIFFHRQDWLGGYDSWRRRMLRLGHISFLGTGLLNLGYGLSIIVLQVPPETPFASLGFMLGAVTMPLVCFLSAWNIRFRHLFFIPVLSLLLATADFLWKGFH